MNLVLALDTSTRKITLALFDGNLYTLSYTGNEKHAAKLAILTRDLIEMSKKSPRDIEIIGLGIGPGSLTGLRVGMSFAVGMASINGSKIVPLNSLEIVAHSVPWEEVAVVRKARKGYVYLQVFPYWKEPKVLDIESAEREIGNLEHPVVVGDGKDLFSFRKALDYFDYPLPEVLIDLTMENSEKAIDYTQVKPLYVQKSIAEINFERRIREGKR